MKINLFNRSVEDTAHRKLREARDAFAKLARHHRQQAKSHDKWADHLRDEMMKAAAMKQDHDSRADVAEHIHGEIYKVAGDEKSD